MALQIKMKLQKIMNTAGYGHLIEGKTLTDILKEIQENFNISIEDIDESDPFELVKFELKDAFYQKNWITIDTFLGDDILEKLYHILCDYKRL
jgi:tRNA U34 5-carboxymethylaminomethyl modifying GTPase MnmE/TrmE